MPFSTVREKHQALELLDISPSTWDAATVKQRRDFINESKKIKQFLYHPDKYLDHQRTQKIPAELSQKDVEEKFKEVAGAADLLTDLTFFVFLN